MHEALTRSKPRLAYRVFGTGGSPVLFVMGFGMAGGVWGPQVDVLSRDHRCCHYDHLGVGDSDPGPMWPTIASMAENALRIMDDIGWARAHVVGVSMGGMIAQEIALRAAERCLSLTFIATHAGGPGASLPTPQGLRLFVQGIVAGEELRLRSLPRLLYTEEFLSTIDQESFRAHMGARLGKPAKLRTLLGQLFAVQGHDTRARLSEIDMPTLLVRPGRDILIRPEQTDRIAARIPSAEVLRFDDAGHGVTFQKKDELNEALRAHFARSSR